MRRTRIPGCTLGLVVLSFAGRALAQTPVLTSVVPSTVAANSPVTLTLNGSNFASNFTSGGEIEIGPSLGGSLIFCSYAGCPITENGATQLTVTFTPGSTGETTIAVINPGGGTSNSLPLTIVTGSNNPVPTLAFLSPASATAGGTAFTLTLTGSNFVDESVVQWNGASRTTTYSSSTSLMAQISAADISGASIVQVTVFNPGPGGGTSRAGTFYVTASEPSNPNTRLLTLIPASAPPGGAGFTLTVSGKRFATGTVVLWNGAALQTTFVSSTELQAQVPAASLANPTAASVSISPAPPGVAFRPATFTVLPPAGTPLPSIVWVSPVDSAAGSSAAMLTISGANFVAGSMVQWNGAARPTTFVNSNQLTGSLTTADLADAGLAAISVLNPSGGGTSARWLYPIVTAGVTTFAAGPQPTGSAPVAVAVDPGLSGGRIYVVHRLAYRDVEAGFETAPPAINVVTVVNQQTGAVIGTIGVGGTVNGAGQGIAVDTMRHMVYVSNTDDNTVTVIDGATNTTVATVAVDSVPEGVAVDAETGIVYVAGSNVTLLDATNRGAVLGSISVGAQAFGVTVDPSTHLAYALVNSIPRSVAQLDGAHGTNVWQVSLPPGVFTPNSIAVDPGSQVYVSDYNSGEIYPITVGGTAGTVISSGTGYVQAVAVDPASHLVFATAANSVYVLNGSGTLRTLAVLRSPTALFVDTASGNTYVADTYSDSLTVLNTAQQAVTGAIPLGTQVFGLAFDASSGMLYAANFGADAVSTIDATHTFSASWPSGGGTWSVAVDAGLKLVHALNPTDGTLTIFNSTDGSMRAQVNLGAVGPGVVAVNSTTDMVYVSGNAGAIWAVNPMTTPLQVVTVPVSGTTTTVGIAIDEAAGLVYVAQTGSGTGTITVLNAADNQVVTSWNTSQPAWKLAVDPVMNRLYASAPDGSDDGTFIGRFTGLLVIDTTSGNSVTQIASAAPANIPEEVMPSANAVAVNPVTHHVFFSDSGNGTVTAVDGSLTVPAVIATVVTGTGADGLAVDSANGLIYAANINDATIAVFADPAAPNPVPVLSSLAPAGAVTSGPAFTLTVNGSNFLPGSTVQWNGSARNTSFLSGTQLQAAVLATDIASPAAIPVTVVNPAPGGGSSNALTFQIPAVLSVDPDSGQPGLTLANVAVTGEFTDFVQGTTVASFGAGITVNSVTATSAAAAAVSITIAANATLGPRDVTMTTGTELATLAGGFTVAPFSPCDSDHDGSVTVSDVQKIVDEVLGILQAVDDLKHAGVVSVTDIQIVVNTVLGLGCSVM